MWHCGPQQTSWHTSCHFSCHFVPKIGVVVDNIVVIFFVALILIITVPIVAFLTAIFQIQAFIAKVVGFYTEGSQLCEFSGFFLLSPGQKELNCSPPTLTLQATILIETGNRSNSALCYGYSHLLGWWPASCLGPWWEQRCVDSFLSWPSCGLRFAWWLIIVSYVYYIFTQKP